MSKFRRRRELIAALTKSADSVGSGQDLTFEQTFADLAHSYISEQSPSLMQYAVGFQLLERADDNKRAIGIFGFHVDPHWLYAPVFFLKGELKGHELLYVKGQDAFVPLQESWVNYFLHRKPSLLGSAAPRSASNTPTSSPDLSVLGRGSSKFASYPAWLRDVMPALAHAATRMPTDKLASLPDFLANEGPEGARLFSAVVNEYPSLLDNALTFHGRDKMAEALAAARTPRPIVKVAEAIKAEPKLTWRTQHDATQSLLDAQRGLTPEDLATLQRDGALFVDKRAENEVAVPFTIREDSAVTNPTKSGFFRVLNTAGGFDDYLVLLGLHGPHGTTGLCAVIDTDKPSFRVTSPTRVWVDAAHDEKAEGKFTDWLKGLPSVGDLPYSDTVMLLNERGDVTVPIDVSSSVGSADGTVSYRAHFNSYDCSGCTDDRGRTPSMSGVSQQHPSGSLLTIHDSSADKLRSRDGQLFAPKSSKVLKLGYGGYRIELGTFGDVRLQIQSKSAELKVARDRGDTFINGQRVPDSEAMKVLVADIGLRVPAARAVLSQADAASVYGRSYSCRLKQAEMPDFGSIAPTFPAQRTGSDSYRGGQSYTTLSPQVDRLPVTALRSMDAPRNSPPPEIDPLSVQTAQNAAQTGQKELFDVSVLTAMLKATSDDMLVDRYLKDLFKGMDRKGRMLFMLYWHRDAFEERYGDDQIPEIEDGLRNGFTSDGGLMITLKERSARNRGSDSGRALSVYGTDHS